ncbi:uncharacterized protein LOC133192635 [Saccostrea echinata]|uniref:uncharacterized protein LOC133192635 n=1 Tax=Saccostrea echinata TaxID=191078 RepID=UPI002A7F3168|nr:uncharacterized protein LOC133192635 [Saccostrea echinata]
MPVDKKKMKDLHINLISTIALDYLDPSINSGHDHQRFLLNCRRYLKTPREQSIRDVVKVLDCFEQKGLMSPGHYHVLKDVVKDVNVQIVELIEETEGKMGISGREGDSYSDEERSDDSKRRKDKDNKASQGGKADGASNVHYTFNIGDIDAGGGVVAFGNAGNARIKQTK